MSRIVLGHSSALSIEAGSLSKTQRTWTGLACCGDPGSISIPTFQVVPHACISRALTIETDPCLGDSTSYVLCLLPFHLTLELRKRNSDVQGGCVGLSSSLNWS